MPYRILWTHEASDDLAWLAQRYGAHHRATVDEGVNLHLAFEPTKPSRRRKRMDLNPLGATWELRLDDLRAYYDIDDSENTVWVLSVGIKDRNRVFVRGVEIDLRSNE